MGKFFTTMTVVSIVLVTMVTASLAQSIERVRFGVHPNMTRVVLDVNGDAAKIAYHVAPADQSNALHISFPKEVSWNAPNSLSNSKGAINGYQFKVGSNSGALAISTNTPVKIKSSFILPKSGKNSARIVFDLVKDLSPKKSVKSAAQRISAPPPQPLKPMASPAEPVQLAQATPMPREPWLKNWLSTPTPGKASPVKQPTYVARPTQRRQRTNPAYGLRPYSPTPAPVATAPTPAGFNNQSMPVVSDSLGPRYQLPQSAQLDPLQKQAQTTEITKGTYIGGGLGISFIDQNISSGSDSAEIDGSPTYFKVFAGHRFNRFYSAELFYSNLGKSSSTSIQLQSAEVELSAAGAAFQLGYPILEQLVPFAKVGIVALHEDAKIGGDDVGSWLPRSYLGLGIDYWLTPHIGIRGEYENFALDNDTISGSLLYKF
jgi:hypothetical protein